MADKEIPDLTAGSAVDGSEYVHIVQGGNSRKVTIAELITWLLDVYEPADGDILVYDVGTGAFLNVPNPNGTPYTDDDARAAVSIAPTTIAGATYTLDLLDAHGYLRATNAGGCDITVPPLGTEAFELGTVITIRAATAGTVTLIEGSGVTLNPPGGAGGSLDFAEEGATVQIKLVDASGDGEWDVIGGTAA